MPCRYTRWTDPPLVIEAWIGNVTKQDLFAHELEHLADPEQAPSSSAIVDFSKATVSPDVGFEELRQLTDLYRGNPLLNGARVAIVAPNEFQRARMYEVLAGEQGIDVIVFNSLDTACTWLNTDVRKVHAWLRQVYADERGS